MKTGEETEVSLGDDFIDVFDSIYIDKMLDVLQDAADTLSESKIAKENE